MTTTNNQNNSAAKVQPPIPPAPPVTTSPPLPPLPSKAPSSDNPIKALAPGWRFQPGKPGTMADTDKVVEGRIIDASKIYKNGASLDFAPGGAGNVRSFASNTVEGPASIAELARALKNDPQLIFEYVYNNIEWQPGWGVMKGALGCLLDGSGNSFDQSMLLVALLRQAGFTASYVKGQIQLNETQFDDWFNTSHIFAAYYYAQYANIPGNFPVWDGVQYNMVMGHVWVQVVISGTTYVLDPSYKTYTRKAPVVGLAGILGYNQATFLADAQSGATVDGSGNFVQNMNTKNINADLQTMTSNLVTYIKNNAVGSAPAGTATMDDVLGGQEIVPVTLPFAWSTTLAYEAPGDVPTVWAADVPLAYKTTLQVQYPLSGGGWAIDQTFTSDQLGGTRLTLTFDAGLHPVLTLNGTVIATGSEAQGAGTYNSVLLTVNHNAYASPVYPLQWWQGSIYAGQYYLIANAWGMIGRGQANYHQRQLLAAAADSTSTTERSIGETLSYIWFNLVGQSSRVAELVGRINSTNMNFFHQVGIVSYTHDVGTGMAWPATDIGGVSGFSSTLNYDFTQLAITNTVVAMHGVALEAATLEQFTGLTPSASTTTVIDKANRSAVVTIGGTVTAGNVLTLTVNDAALSGGTRSNSYTVIGGDTLTTIATALKNAINADINLAAIGVTAISTGPVILISSKSANMTSYTSSTSGGATETIAIAFSKIYRITPANWTTGANISATLTANGFLAGDIAAIGSYIGTGVDAVVVGDQPVYQLDSWYGWGDWIFPNYANNGGALGLINTTAKGGQKPQCSFGFIDGVLLLACGSDGGEDGLGAENPNPGIDPNGQQTSAEPIGLFSGDYFYNRSDIAVGSQAFPYGLSFGRNYNSRNQYKKGVLGWGWSHNHDMTAKIGSDGFLAMGEQFAAQGAASIVELFVSVDLATDSTQPIVKLVTMSLADKWWIDQLVNNTVTLKVSTSSKVFLKQPDGTYTAPASSPGILTFTAGAYSLTTPQGVNYNFNTSGQISSFVTPGGVTVTWTYTSGLLTSISNGLGRTLTLNYTSGVLTSVSDGNGRSVQYALDGSSNLTSFTDANSQVISYQYDQPGRLTKVFLPLNPATPIVTNVYDTLSRVQTQANARGQVWTYYFAGARTEEVDPLTNQRVLYFNRLGRTTRSINALSFEAEMKYDGLNRLIETTLPEGNKVVLTYDANNSVLTKTYVPKSGSGLSNIQFVYTYDSTWAKVKTVVDGNSKTTTFSYDPVNGNLLTVTKPLVGGLTPQAVFTYNARGQLLTVTDETGIVTKLNYDVATEKLTSAVADYSLVGGHLNLTTSFGYDAVGNLNSITDPNTNQTTFVFDNERRRTKVTSAAPFNFVTNVAFDVNGSVTSVQRQLTSAPTWQTTSFTYTISDKILTSVDPVGRTTTWSYDGADRVQTILDAQGRLYQFAYDALNRVSTVTDPSSTVASTKTYTNNGLLKTIKDANNNVTQFAYDGLDRPSVTTFADSTTSQVTSYDGNSNVLTAVRRSGNSIVFTYDALNRVSTKAPAGQPTVTYGYDLANRLTSVSKPVVGGDPSSGNFQRFYDTAGRFFQEQYPDGKTVTHVLDANSNRTKTTWPDGYFVTRTFDQLNRLTNIFLNGSGASSLIYAYDQLSRRASVTMGNGASTSYAFGLNNNLEALTNSFVGSSNTYAMTYNNSGELVANGVSDTSFVWRPAAAGTVTYGAADNVNKYPSVGGVGYTYDGNKNLTFDGTWTYTFDTENHLVSAVSGGVTASYVYDPLGRQAQKTVSGTATRFVYDGLKLIATYDGSGTLLNRYVHGPGVDEPAIQVTAGAVQTFFHRDFQGTVVATTNNAGAVVNKYTYSPFGESAALSGTIFGYTGQRYDAETGLYYYKARCYSPKIGRFLQTDPIGYGAGDLNLYSYVGNSPLTFKDPLGLTAQGSGDGPDGLIDWLKPGGENDPLFNNDVTSDLTGSSYGDDVYMKPDYSLFYDSNVVKHPENFWDPGFQWGWREQPYSDIPVLKGESESSYWERAEPIFQKLEASGIYKPLVQQQTIDVSNTGKVYRDFYTNDRYPLEKPNWHPPMAPGVKPLGPNYVPVPPDKL
jgi:RHS repeat-associated protein